MVLGRGLVRFAGRLDGETAAAAVFVQERPRLDGRGTVRAASPASNSSVRSSLGATALPCAIRHGRTRARLRFPGSSPLGAAKDGGLSA
jgi:hypothetical protein